MKKIVAMVLTLMLIVAMAVPAAAVTPPLDIPSISIPDISDDVHIDIDIPDSFWDQWFKDHPIEIPGTTEPDETVPGDDASDETEPDETAPEVIDLTVPIITEARYYHKGIERLQIHWDAVEYADSYVVLIIKADGSITTHIVTTNMLYLKDAECPKVYVEDSSTWASATVRVMAVTGTVISEWSNPAKIGCDMLHST